MTYDEASRRLEEIIVLLEDGQALSMDAYRRYAAEAKSLLDFCHAQITSLENDLNALLPEAKS